MNSHPSLTTGGPLPGSWELTGIATDDVAWSARLTLLRTDGEYSGNLEWRKCGMEAGTEWFTGKYDPATKEITLTGVTVTGEIATATYVARVSIEGTSMTNGTWVGSCGTDGTWHAERRGE